MRKQKGEGRKKGREKERRRMISRSLMEEKKCNKGGKGEGRTGGKRKKERRGEIERGQRRKRRSWNRERKRKM